jgi:penicillin-binding protein 2
MDGRLPRRAFLKLMLVSLASACAPKEAPSLPAVEIPLPVTLVPPTPTTVPTPTPTPLPSADGTVAAFLSAWSAGDYDTMYNLLIDSDRLSVSSGQFRARYVNALHEATASAVRTEVHSLLHDGPRALAGFRVEWKTTLFGPLEVENTMPLVWEGAGWGIDWSPSLILPQLDENLTLALLDHTPIRGNIYDRSGLGLAVDGRVVTIGVVPGWIVDEATVVEQLNIITGTTPEVIQDKIANSQPDWFVPIADVNPEVSINNDEALASLTGVSRRERTVRVYKTADLGAHLVGYMGAIPLGQMEDWQLRGYRGDELVGLAGVEAWGEPYLAGRRGGRLVALTEHHGEVAQVAEAFSRPGGSIYMTIDRGLQGDAERVLGDRPGAIVVLDPNTGFVLAMASYPRFDPGLFVTGIDQEAWTELNNDPHRPLVGRGTQGAYPPGSVFKMVTMTAAMDKLGFGAETPFVCTGSWNRLGDEFVKSCWLKTGHGSINLQDGLTQSCDVVFYDVGLALQDADPQILPDMARAFGLGVATGIAGVEETAGLVPDLAWKLAEKGEGWFPGDSVNLAIGQSYLLATPLQIANVLAGIGNGGTLYRPQLVHRITKPVGADQVYQPEVLARLPVTPEHLAVIRTALEAVVTGHRGTAREAFEGAAFTAAGKTGTSETSQEDPHAWFAGYAPADSPQVAVAVILEHAGEGSKEAAPVFRQMVEAYLARQSDLGRSPTVIPRA